MSNDSSIKIGELLVRAGVVTGVDLSEAEKLAKHMQVQFGRILIMSGCLTEHDLECALEAQVLIKNGKLALEIACDALALASRDQIPFAEALAQSHVPEPGSDHTLAMAELLADAEIVSPDELEAALDASLESKNPLAEVLIASNVISPLVEAIVEEMLVQLKKGERTRDAAIAEIRKTHAVWKRADESLKSDEDSLPSVAASLAEIATAQNQAAPAAPRDPRQDYAESPVQATPYYPDIPGGYGSSPSQPALPAEQAPPAAPTPAAEPASPGFSLPQPPKFQSSVLGYQLRPEDAPQAPQPPQQPAPAPAEYDEQPAYQPPSVQQQPQAGEDHLSIHQVLSSYSSEIIDDTGPASKQRQTPEPVEWLQTLLATAQSAPPQPAGSRQAQSADTWHLVPPAGQQSGGNEGWKKFDGQIPWTGATAEAPAAPPLIPPAQPVLGNWPEELEHSAHPSAPTQPPPARVHSRHLSEQHLPLIGGDQEHERDEAERLQHESDEWQRLEALRLQQELREQERLAALAEAEKEQAGLEAEQALWERQRLAEQAALEQAERNRQRLTQQALFAEAERQRLAAIAASEEAERDRQRLIEQAALEQERLRLAEQAAFEQAEAERRRLEEQAAAEQAARQQERMIAEAAQQAERERLAAEEAERAREQERLITLAADLSDDERSQAQAADDAGAAATNKVNALARLRPTNPQIIAQARQSGASIPAVSDTADAPIEPPAPPLPAVSPPPATAAKPPIPKVQGGKTVELETPNVKRAPVSRTAPIIELLQTAGAFTTGELGTAVARALADQDRAGELVRLLGLVTKELVDAAGKCCKAIADEQLTYDQARLSILSVKDGKPLREALLEAGMDPEALANAIPDAMAESEQPEEGDSPLIDDAMDLGSSEPSPGPVTLDDLDKESGKSFEFAPPRHLQSYAPPELQQFAPEGPKAPTEHIAVDEPVYADSRNSKPEPTVDEQTAQSEVSMIVPVIDEAQQALPEVDPVASAMNDWAGEEEPILFAPDANGTTMDRPTNPFSHLNKAPAVKTHVIVASDSGTAIEPFDDQMPEPSAGANALEPSLQEDFGAQDPDEGTPPERSETADLTENEEPSEEKADAENQPPSDEEEERQFSQPPPEEHGEEVAAASTQTAVPSVEQPQSEHNGVKPEQPEEEAPARARKSRAKTDKAEKSDKPTEKAAATKAKKPTKRKR